ncbi:MAG TPA: TetR family transcriptional regulator [Terriglobales bacterium]|nr:TetR family transcriptional regulator [Terriglobales bacterium]
MNSSSERNRPRRRRDREAKRRALVSAAISLFSRKGYDPTTTREIAAQAGCAEGLIHRYFGAKSGLLLAILEAISSSQDSPLEGASECNSLAEELQRLMRLQLDHLWKKRDYLRISFSQAFRDPRFGAALWEVPRKRTKLLAQQLRHNHGRWAISENDCEALAHAITAFSFVFGFIRPVVLGQSRKQTQDLAFKVVALMARAARKLETTTLQKRSNRSVARRSSRESRPATA